MKAIENAKQSGKRNKNKLQYSKMPISTLYVLIMASDFP